MTANPIPIRGGESDYLAELRDEGIVASLATSMTDMRSSSDYEGVDLALVDTTAMADATVKACILEFTRLKIPTIALVPEHGVGMFDPSLPFADVMVVPSRPRRDHPPRKAAPELAAGEERQRGAGGRSFDQSHQLRGGR